ncbi:MAG: site-2 protease family protein [Negativibacillus sp.]
MNLSLQSLVIRAFVLLTAMPIHECAHALVANWLGDRTAEDEGRLTLNPFSHLDLMGSLMILVAGFGWAKPVPVNPLNFRRNGITMRGGMALTAIAGPLSNLLLALIFFIACKLVLVLTELPIMLAYALMMIAQINVMLGVFNLLPVYPMDGSRVLGYFLPDNALNFLERNQGKIQLIFMAVILLTDVLNTPLYLMENAVLRVFDVITSIGGLLPRIM